MNLPFRATDKRNPELMRARVEFTYAQGRLAVAAYAVNAAILMVFARERITEQHLFWFALVLLVVVLRFLHIKRFEKQMKQELVNPRPWLIAYVVNVAFSGVLLGATAFLFIEPSVPSSTLVTTFLAGGMVVGGAYCLAALPLLASSYSILAICPFIVRFVSSGSEVDATLALLLVVFVVAMDFAVRQFSRLVGSVLELKADKSSLSRELMEKAAKQEELRQEVSSKANLLKMATTAANIGVWDWEIKTNRIVWNDTMYKIYGFEPDNELSPEELWLSVVHPDDVEQVKNIAEKALGGHISFNIEFRIRRSDNSERYLRTYGAIERNVDCKPLRMIGVTWDVTAELTAVRANETSSGFDSNLSQEIRAPISEIISFAELLLVAQRTEEEAQANLAMILSNAKQLLQAVDDNPEYHQDDPQLTGPLPRLDDSKAR